MKTILVDAIHTLFNPEGGINQPLFQYLNSLSNPKIIVTNATPQKIEELNLQKTNYPIFTQAKSPDKSDPRYFVILLQKHNLTPENIIYLDHKDLNLQSAKSLDIKCIKYNNNLNEIQQFINQLN